MPPSGVIDTAGWPSWPSRHTRHFHPGGTGKQSGPKHFALSR